MSEPQGQTGDHVKGVRYVSDGPNDTVMAEFDSFPAPIRQAIANMPAKFAIMQMRKTFKGMTIRQIVDDLERGGREWMIKAYKEKGCPHDL